MSGRFLVLGCLILLAMLGMHGVQIFTLIDIALASLVMVGIPVLVYYAYSRNSRLTCRIGELAVQKKWLTEEQVAQILCCQQECSDRFGEIAVQRNYLSDSEVEMLVAEQIS